MKRTWVRARQRSLGGRALRARAWAGAVLLGAFLVTQGAAAQSRTQFLIERLRADDFKVRASAALALGATNDDAAIQPLCGALSDSSEAVRQSAAAGLKRLAKPSSLGCLRSRAAVEQNATVKLQITRAIDAIESGGDSGPPAGSASDGPPKFVANAKYYVALSSVQNNTGRPQGEVDGAVLGSVKTKLDTIGHFQIAPNKEAPDAARSVINQRKLKGYYLAIVVEPFDYSGGDLSVRVRISFFTYPGKDLRGSLTTRLIASNVRGKDTSTEDSLLKDAAADAAAKFAKVAPDVD